MAASKPSVSVAAKSSDAESTANCSQADARGGADAAATSVRRINDHTIHSPAAVRSNPHPVVSTLIISVRHSLQALKVTYGAGCIAPGTHVTPYTRRHANKPTKKRHGWECICSPNGIQPKSVSFRDRLNCRNCGPVVVGTNSSVPSLRASTPPARPLFPMYHAAFSCYRHASRNARRRTRNHA